MSTRRLWLFRCAAFGGSLLVSSGTGWLAWYGLAPSGSERAQAAFDAACQALPETSRIVLREAGYARDERLVLTANFDSTLIFSGRVMERDELRGYRLRPSQENLWTLLPGFPHQLLLPDTPQVRDAMAQAGLTATAHERVNSHGCRGADWDDPEQYQFRVLLLGDSFVQGILVEEPAIVSTRLEEKLQRLTGLRTLVANAGVIGYSTEQEYYTLVEQTEAVRPHAVVLCLFANDVGHNHQAILRGERAAADWDSARHWLGRCATLCRQESVQFMVAVVPERAQASSRLSRLHYQHALERVTAPLGIYVVDPWERFLARRDAGLWLEDDAHFSPAGHDLFAETLAEHLEVWARQLAA